MNDTQNPTLAQTPFDTLGVSAHLVAALQKLNITTATPIQKQSIPLLLEGKDILASAQTGTGKTIAYLLPILQGLLSSNDDSTALVLVPTRELAVQVKDSILDVLGRGSSIFTAVLIGGEPMARQFAQLKRRPRIVVATPGRLNDHLQRGSVKLNTTRYLVLDETDRMLDMGFADQLEAIVDCLPKKRQTMMFSATMPGNMMKLASNYLNDPQRIAVGVENQAVAKIKQEMVRTSQGNKLPLLLKELDQREGSVIIFVKTKMGAEQLASQLRDENHSVDAIHGDLKQNHRTKVIQAFRNRKSRIMVATDVAARGLDVPHIQHVINYDLPQCPEDYIHRIGRTGRAGAEGFALCFVAPNETGKWNAIHRLMNPGEKGASSGSSDDQFPRHQERRRSGNGPFGGKPRSASGGAFGAPKGDGGFDGKKRFGKPRFSRDNADAAGGRSFDKPRFPRDNADASGNKSFDKPRFPRDNADASGNRSFDKPRFPRDNADAPGNRSFDKPRFKSASGDFKSGKPSSIQDSVKGGIKKFFSKPFGSKKRG
ncbi:MAG: DEAD/DEAH box helicase [Alphaproteobacteria bacterium]|nr:DEAD/DEAH box helicase [Alphaproteobacteria bacterium]